MREQYEAGRAAGAGTLSAVHEAVLVDQIHIVEDAFYAQLGFRKETNCSLFCETSWRLPFTFFEDQAVR